ncbi:Succinate--CoA ligase (ADP-forming) [Sulfolobus islandicus Y.G.57.14]|jgi:succinyl-CoA synthetase beta subunit|uniref:Succinyl-CoA synthetase, beta subunit (SucC) n=5 Tax=Saccharolobus TaxID=2100760 RepID=Q97VX1_SACS2|nr:MULTISPECIES: succinate--CoA ligase subunit beta [Sulfolobaceae]AAK42619.1 Succinyl-CoA synthetase, beta subunit (sucC) [Saccharolobus solfataricus P2]ACP34457.1 Succinate--CoA ligase (ADP-forming) [Sulfolobus islandicus L.S.2.15]ACP44572.1 Succinate--CoA ligase (ADP-forming) [Sulfolobus islandicus Y.G.57.14]ACP49785.1 Succinate--CoA ligase (ADP-forming) [Sulfolobus islandicus Y.N.15.51]ADB86079.1 Succinate--CoA ligase (ADP-forming) [Sulfolobus islandicus L.D.8.5]
MKLYEYEGKSLFKRVGIPVPNGVVTSEPIRWQGKAVVKSQLLEGARGKRGLVRVTEDIYNTILELKKLGVEKFLVEEFVPHEKEIYASVLLDRETAEPMLVLSREGGIDVEQAKDVKKMIIPLERGVRSYDIVEAEKYLGVKGLGQIIQGLYKLFVDYDAELVEINPLALTNDGRILALDSKVILEDNALYRHEDLLKELGRQEVRDSYVELEGDIGIIGNGAGLTMASMDLVKLNGGNPANFLDVGGGANREHVKESVLKVGSNPRVKKIVINIYGGITRCDEVALGIIDALKEVKKPIFVRLLGTNEELGKKILRENGVNVYDDVLKMIGDAVRS